MAWDRQTDRQSPRQLQWEGAPQAPAPARCGHNTYKENTATGTGMNLRHFLHVPLFLFPSSEAPCCQGALSSQDSSISHMLNDWKNTCNPY